LLGLKWFEAIRKMVVQTFIWHIPGDTKNN
jgi:hypothetical protein